MDRVLFFWGRLTPSVDLSKSNAFLHEGVRSTLKLGLSGPPPYNLGLSGPPPL